ncbi:uncharacterized protein LOC132722061 [Ruditapes philippinarum]|uniref:uncharacterized protein LOC132722061 n=1 Tax=Ruditapes philippinarum TaxID=129788 RepID=UPI00295C2186|nr:uncharacterized protein LOC132722061 [Ruditapes philippinarum]
MFKKQKLIKSAERGKVKQHGDELNKKQSPKLAAEMESVRITRSSPQVAATTPSSLYDFMGESPLSDSSKNNSKKQVVSKSDEKKKVKKTTAKGKSTKTKQVSSDKIKLKAGSTKTADAVSKATVTPKGRSSKVIISIQNANVEQQKEPKQGNSRFRALKPIPQPNLDDISPIIRDRKSKTPTRTKRSSDSKTVENDSVERKKLRSSTNGTESKFSGSVSYMEAEESSSSNDSAIFVSPRQTMPRFNAAKTSTPAEVSGKSKKLATKKVSKHAAKNTSTPNEFKPKKNFTGLKENIAKLSPVQRLDTPTSDYGSMEIIPSPSPKKVSRRKRESSPAFTLDEDDSGENINLNKSVDKSYKRSKKKFETGYDRLSTSKIDEWADKVNSELEDIENFELSVEG